MPLHSHKPSPVPTSFFVVKNGSKSSDRELLPRGLASSFWNILSRRSTCPSVSLRCCSNPAFKSSEVAFLTIFGSQQIEVQKLAEQAVEAFGHIDVWINDAGIGLYSRFEESPTDEFRQVIETNLFGAIYGAREAVKQFRRQGSGMLVNESSQLALGGAPYSSAYVISKYGMRALSDTLREELFQTGIHVYGLSRFDRHTIFSACRKLHGQRDHALRISI